MQQRNLSVQSKKYVLWLALAVLLIAAFFLISHADELATWADESWTVFHSSASLGQIAAERDITWPLGSFVVLHLWGTVASWNDFSLHVFGVLCGLLSTAFLIQIGKRLKSPSAGLLAALAFATSSYALYFLLEIRGYSLMLLTETAFVAVYLRWLKRSTWGRSVALFAVQAAMLYTHFILGVVLALAGLHLLLTAPRKLFLWLGIALATAIAFIPLIPQFQSAMAIRGNLAGQTLPNYATRDFLSFITAFSAHWDLWFGLILILCAVGLIRTVAQGHGRQLIWLAVWGIAIPLVAYAIRYSSLIFTTRYLTFTLPAIFLLIGIGLAAIPIKRNSAWIGTAALLILALAPWQPYDHRPAPSSDGPPLHELFRTMSARFQPGDIVAFDPNLTGYDPLALAYYKQLYYPQGTVARGKAVPTARRVWYVVRQGSEDQPMLAAVQQGRLATDFWGPWYLATTLYEAPPSTTGLLFGDSLRFYGADVQRRSALHAGDSIGLTLWWSSEKPITQPLSVSIQVVNADGEVVAQGQDGPPKAANTPDMTTWTQGALYLDERQVQIPYQPHIASGAADEELTVQLIVYQSWDGTRLIPAVGAGSANDVTAAHGLIIDRATLYSYASW
jgi:Dolichyl-phosphate-mannose-protein mannosyltransferase